MVKKRIQQFLSLIRLELLSKLFKNEKMEERTYLAITIITAISSAIAVVALEKIIDFAVEHIHTNQTFTLKSCLFGLGAVFISGYLTTRFFPETQGSGIPKTIVSLAVHHANFITAALTLV